MKESKAAKINMKAENRYDSLFQFYASTVNLNWIELKAQAKAESWNPKKKDFNPEAESPVGAVGLTQFMKMTWLEWQDGTPGIQLEGIVFDRKNPEWAIRAQAKYMNALIKFVNNNSYYHQQKVEAMKWAFAAYNWGPGRIQKLLSKYEFFENAVINMPKETQGYVERIYKFIDEYNLINNEPIEVNFPISSFPDFGDTKKFIK